MGRQKDFFTIFLGTGMNVILGIITTPIITRLVAPDVYGELSLFNLYGNILLILCSLGQDQAYNRFYYAHEEICYKKHILRLTAKIPLLLSFTIGLLVILYYVFFDRDNYLLPIFSLFVFSLVINRYNSITVRLRMHSVLYSVLMNLQKISYTLIVVCAVLLTEINHLYILTGATVAGYVIANVIGIVAEKDEWSLDTFFGKKAVMYKRDVSYREIFLYSWPFVFTYLCSWVFTGADKIMIEVFSSEIELGIYASAASIIGLFSVITSTFNTVWAPMAVQEYEKGADESFFVKATDYVSVILFAAGAWVIILKDVIVFFLGPEYRDAAMLLPALTLQPIMYSISESTVYGINFKKKTHYHMILTFICSILNIVINLLLIPRMGALGASIATGVTYIVLFSLRTWLSVRCFPVKYNIWKIVVLLIPYISLVVYTSFYAMNLISVVLFGIVSFVGITIYWGSIKELATLLVGYILSILKK